MSKRGTVYILGAGASYVSPAPEARLPLQNGFFASIATSKLVPQQMVLEGFMQQPFKQWLLRKGYGEPYNPKSRLTNDFMINLEEFYSEIETDSGINSDDKTDILRILDRIIFESVSIPLCELRNNPNKSCPNHRALAGLIMPGDTIINFNYDCLADDALLYFCPSWHPLTGHGFNFNDVFGGAPPDKAKIFGAWAALFVAEYTKEAAKTSWSATTNLANKLFQSLKQAKKQARPNTYIEFGTSFPDKEYPSIIKISYDDEEIFNKEFAQFIHHLPRFKQLMESDKCVTNQ